MSVKIGNTNINKIYLGNIEIKKAYLGSTVIYETDEVSYFTFIVNTENVGSSNNDQFTLPLISSSTVNCTVNWGDGITNTVTSYNDANATHTYAVAGEYTIKISGVLNGWQFIATGDDDKILEISNWGPFDVTENNAFYGCSVLGIRAVDAPTISGTDNLHSMFRNCTDSGMDDLDLTNWDFSGQESLQYFMRYMYYSNPKGLDTIDVSSVTNFFGMFHRGWQINQSFAAWNIEAGIIFGDFMLDTPGLESTNYDLTLASWGAQNVSLNEAIDFGNSQYTLGSAGEAGRNALIAKGWTINDGGDTTMSRTTNPDMADGLGDWTNRNGSWSPSYFGSAYLEHGISINASARVNQNYKGQVGVVYKFAFDLMENNGCTSFRIYNGAGFITVFGLRLGTNTRFIKWVPRATTVYFENNTSGSNVYVKNCTMHEAQYGDDIFNTGLIQNNNGAIATYITGGVNVVSDGTATNFIRPSLLWNDLKIGSTYRVVSTYSMNSGSEPGWSFYNGSSYEFQNQTITDDSFIFEAESSNVFMAWDGQEVFDLDMQVTLEELLLNLGTEEITNGDFTTDSDWTTGTTEGTAEISGGSMNFVGAKSGGTNIEQRVSNYDYGKTYEVTYTISNYVAGTVRLSVGNNLTTARSANGTYTESIHYSSGLARTYIYTNITTCSIDNVSIKEILSDFGQSVITNGDFTTDSSWTKGTGWSINTSIGEAECDGTQVANSLLTQSSNLEIGVTYKVTYTISNYVSGSVFCRLGFGSQSAAKSANGTYSEDITCSGSTNFDIFAPVGFEGNVSWISVKEIL